MNEIIFYSTLDGDKKAGVLFQDENFRMTRKATSQAGSKAGSQNPMSLPKAAWINKPKSDQLESNLLTDVSHNH